MLSVADKIQVTFEMSVEPKLVEHKKSAEPKKP
jgi:hypothetical protein